MSAFTERVSQLHGLKASLQLAFIGFGVHCASHTWGASCHGALTSWLCKAAFQLGLDGRVHKMVCCSDCTPAHTHALSKVCTHGIESCDSSLPGCLHESMAGESEPISKVQCSRSQHAFCAASLPKCFNIRMLTVFYIGPKLFRR